MACINTYDLHHIIYIASILKLMHTLNMRTTITIADDTHGFVSYYARAKGISFSGAIDELIRKAQAPAKPEPDIRRGPNGLPMFPPTGRTITSEMVKAIEEEEFDPEKFA
jgi:hypothetical protein